MMYLRKTNENIEKIGNPIRSDRWLSISEIHETVGIDKGMRKFYITILTECENVD